MNKIYSVNQSPSDIREIKRITLIGIVFNVILFVVKFFLGIVGASQALIADAFHSLTDLGTDFVLLIGLYFWSKPADLEHPYGHRRIETMVTLVIGLSLAAVALVNGYHALITIQDPDNQQPHWIAFAGAVFSIICKEIIYRWTIAVGQKVKSSAVIANAWEHRSDVFTSIPVALVIAVSAINPQWSFWDHVGALVVSCFILYSAWALLSPAFLELIDTGASERERRQIKDLAIATPGVRSVHAIRTRRVGPGWFTDLHIQVDPKMSVREGHEISGIVKHNLLANGPDVLDVIVHLEPDE